jgi:hypothetical protein
MNLKNLITKIAVKEVAGKILPMDEAPKPALGWKAKLAGVLGVLHLSARTITPQELQTVQTSLAARGYQLRAEDDNWRMRVQEGSP